MPVKSCRTAYPSQYEVDLKPLLLSAKPKSWPAAHTTPLLLCALAAAGLAGCAATSAAPPDDVSASPTPRKMHVAPIFDGASPLGGRPIDDVEPSAPAGLARRRKASGLAYTTGGTKAYSIAPLGNYPGPYPGMPEETALDIISEALAAHGLTAGPSEKQVAVTDDASEDTPWSFDLSVTGGQEPIYIEYVPAAEIESEPELHERAAGLPDTAREAAEALHDKLTGVYDDSAAAIFYDDSLFFSLDESAHLKAQVAEFVEWLKTMALI
jgi:hypothetical protein